MFKNKLLIDNCAIEPAPLARLASPTERANVPSDQLWSQAAAHENRARRITFIGLDRTGRAMATRLLEAGHQLTVYDPDREVEPLEPVGWRLANSIQDACRSTDAVFTMLPDDQVAKAVILGKGGVVESLPHEAIHVGSTTISVESSDQIVEAHWNAGKQYIAAPLLVRAEATREDQLLVIAGGREATILQMEPVLRAVGQLVRLNGWPSDANVAQLAANCEGDALFQFLARHPEFCVRQLKRGSRARHLFARFLDIEIKGVLS